MIDPRSYTINLPNYGEVAFDGLQQGLKTAIAFGAQDMANQKAEIEARYAKQMQDDFATVAANPIRSTDDLVNLTLKYPDKAEQIKQSYDMLDATKQQAAFKTASRLYVGANSGRFDVVESILDTEISGYENAGETETANYLKQMKTLAQNNPEAFKNLTGFTLASTAPDKFKDILGATDQHEMLPEEINLKKAQTDKTKAEAEKTETETLWYGDKTQAEIDDKNSQIEDRKTGRVLEQQKMQLQNDQFYAKLDQDQQLAYEKLNQEERKQARAMAAAKETPIQRVERVEKAQNFADVAKNAAGTAQLAAQLVNDYKALGDATGAGVWNMARRAIPGTAEYNFSRRVEALKSQAFLISAEKMRGLGSLTESEGKKLENAIASLDLNQSTDQVARSIAEVAKYASSIGQSANKKTQMYATKGNGYSSVVVEAAKARGVSPAEMQQIANQLGIE